MFSANVCSTLYTDEAQSCQTGQCDVFSRPAASVPSVSRFSLSGPNLIISRPARLDNPVAGAGRSWTSPPERPFPASRARKPVPAAGGFVAPVDTVGRY
ncbi:hypothetical protein J6590_043785 [Homalodisca vitripennis]|nr:hypothetical protein J6590_043785 [Homalodisca vitripennis]